MLNPSLYYPTNAHKVKT